ncbi:MAG TPA: TetR/AcrR family transcriptional regulator [Alloacidobacterium sp.]|nr:TetR/AcrR family transcriptional regulator [Alloacidobacterium sp.]
MAGRPREFDKAAALVRARDLFWERGYEGVSMSDLVQALGIASARIYAAFGSKENLFREAIALYEANEGGFADRALKEEPTALRAIERMLREGIELYTGKKNPRGCMVVASATNCSSENEPLREWLEQHRRARTASIVKRIKKAIREGELPKKADAQAFGDLCAAALHGISVQARDGVSRERLLATVPLVLRLLQA